MLRLDSLLSKLITAGRKERFAYSKSIPLKRLLLLLAAAFFIFSSFGLQSSLIGDTSPHLANGFAWALLSGVMAMLWLLVFSRKPLLIPAVIAGQIVVSTATARLLVWIDASQPALPLHTVVQLYAPLTVALTMIAYALFYAFILSEGRFAFRAQTELALAHGIQQTLAPTIHLFTGGCEFYGISLPSEKVGGDLVDVVALTDGRTMAYIADIAGHGLQAGILMGMVKTAVRTRLLDCAALPELFDRLNRVLPGVKESNLYATSAALLIHASSEGVCTIEYALAGHPPMLHLSANGQPPTLLADEQFPLGMLPLATYRSQTTRALQGDLIVVMTDGVLDVLNKAGDDFGIEGLRRIAIANFAEPLPVMAQRILDAAHSWGHQDDDQTLLLVRVK